MQLVEAGEKLIPHFSRFCIPLAQEENAGKPLLA